MNFSNNRGYGDFGGLGGFNSFDDHRSAGGSHNQPQRSWLGEDGGTPISASSGMQNSNRGGGTGGGRHQGAGRGGGAGFGGGGPQPLSSNAPANLNYSMQQEMQWLKQDNLTIRNAVLLLEKEKDNLRQAVRKLKVENSRFKQKLKRLSDTIKSTHPNVDSMEHSDMGGMEVDLDYDEIGRDFILVGGVQDPLSLRYEVAIRDAIGIEHKSAERYYWYKMAETFGDTETLAKILEAPNTIKAEEAMKEIKNFDENTWNGVKMNIWEDGQRMKFEQVRWIANLLVHTGKTYIAVASQDKVFGTGWRKNRDEANKPVFWDGENLGGKALMKIRLHLKEKHAWDGPAEEQETEKKYQELKKMVWRRIDPDRRMGMSSGGSGYGGMSGGGGFRGGNRRGGFGGGSGGRPYGGSRGGGR